MPTMDCGHGNGRRNRLPHLAGSIVCRSRWGRRFRLAHRNPESGYAPYFPVPLALRSATAHNIRKPPRAQKEIPLPRLSIQDFIVILLVATLSFGAAAAEAIGVAAATGSFEVDDSQVYGATTLFAGSRVRTAQASSRLRLKNGTRLELGEESQARVFDKQATLERGMGEVETSSKYQLEARTLVISPSGAKSIARVKLEGEKQVLVAAVNGRVRVSSESGLLVANVESGATLLFTPQAAQAGTFQMSGCLLQTSDGKFLLIEANQTVELRGSGLEGEINNQVEVTGTAFRSAVPAPPAA